MLTLKKFEKLSKSSPARYLNSSTTESAFLSLSLSRFFLSHKKRYKKLPNHEKMVNVKILGPFVTKSFIIAKKFQRFFWEFTPWKLLKQWESERVKKCCRWTLNFTWKFFKIFLLSFSRQLPCHLRSTLFMRISLTFWSFLSLSLRSLSLSCTIYIPSAKVKKGRIFFLDGSVK